MGWTLIANLRAEMIRRNIDEKKKATVYGKCYSLLAILLKDNYSTPFNGLRFLRYGQFFSDLSYLD